MGKLIICRLKKRKKELMKYIKTQKRMFAKRLNTGEKTMFTEKQRKIIQHAYETVPFYMDMSRQKGFDWRSFKDFGDIPIVCKEDLVLRNDSFISARYMAEYLQGRLIQTHTSGSTGKCANVYWDLKECRRSLLPLWIRRKKYYGLNPHDRQCYFFTGRNVGAADVEKEERGFALGFCKSNLTDKELVHIWESMEEFQPVWMNLQPSMAVLLCRVVEKYGLNPIPALRYIETTGEMLFPSIRKYIQERLDVMVADQYGCNELNSLAFECPEGRLHCMEENAVVEIVDSRGNPLPDGKDGEIVVTTLNNFAMPLIRYKIGDRGCFLKEKCPCGNGGKVLKLTTGRSNDWVIDREGNLLNAYIFARCVENVNRIYEHAVLQFQVIQHDVDDFTIMLVLDEECNPDEICDCFMENLWQGTLVGAKFQIQFYPELIPEEKTGKLKWFISQVDENIAAKRSF